jgi:hypothetical protein
MEVPPALHAQEGHRMVGDALFNGSKSALPTSWMQVNGPPREARVANGRGFDDTPRLLVDANRAALVRGGGVRMSAARPIAKPFPKAKTPWSASCF